MKKKNLIMMVAFLAVGLLLIVTGCLIIWLSGAKNSGIGNNGTENGGINPTYCTTEQKNSQVCPQYYSATCGWFNPSIQCIRYPCAATYSNPCTACADSKVDRYTAGECPA